MQPSYLELYLRGQLEERIKQAFKLIESCSICPRRCGINRLSDQKGFCNSGYLPRIYSYMPHFGEEPCISGYRGSGAIFFSGCNMSCVYCQNYKFSQLNQGREIKLEDLAQVMLDLQQVGCHNINLVTPTHIMPQILEALSIAIPKGLRLPLIYNTSGYELPEILMLLDNIIDIFLVDMRYSENCISKRYSNAADYPEINKAAVKQMYKQVGTAKFDKHGLIYKGIIIRHLVLPDNISGTNEIMRFIALEISPETHISLMSQYTPCYKAGNIPELSRYISQQEYNMAKRAMEASGISNGWLQELPDGSLDFAGINIEPR